jgi:5'(3')-deoxyribonucleotidase
MRETFRRNRLRILFDVDGVIADCAQLYTNAIIATGVRSIPPTWRPTQWDIPGELKLSKKEEDEVYQLLTRAGMAQTLCPLPDAVESVLRIAKKVDVYFVTTPMVNAPTWPYDRELWLKRYFGDELGTKVVHTAHKYLISAIHLVDDKADNCRKWEEENPGRAALCWRLPGMQVEKDLICLSDWARVESFVDVAVSTWRHMVE